MATIKSYTDISQSKKLAEILPLESADMGWNVFVDDTTRILPIDDWDLTKDGSGGVKFFHAWSLAALLKLIPNPTLILATTDCCKLVWGIGEIDCDGQFEDFGTVYGNTPVDAAYNTIVYLIEQGYIKTEKN